MEDTLKNMISTQYETIQKYHTIMMLQEREIKELREKITRLETRVREMEDENA